MFAKRIAPLLTFGGMILLLVAGAAAQTVDHRSTLPWKWLTSGAAADGTPLADFSKAISQLPSGSGEQLRLEGTWQISQLFTPDDADPSLYTFSGGADPDHGTVVMSDSFIFTASPSCINAQGSWKRIGDRSFVGTHKAFCFDPDNGFVPAGYVLWQYAVTLSEDGSTLLGRELLQLFDLDGNLLAGGPAALQGTRLEAHLPPQ